MNTAFELAKTQLKGVWPAMFTPSNDDGTVNFKETEKLIEMLIAEGVDGLYILGSTGQGFSFTEAERKLITEQMIKMVDKRVPVIVQVGAISTDECCRLASHAQQVGAEAVSSVGPVYYANRGEMAYEHYKKIASCVDIPFIPYQIGTATNRPLVDKLLTISNITGMKLTTNNLLEINSVARQTEGKWQLFSGADELICQAAMCGTIGAIGSTYNVMPGLFKEVRLRFLNGEVAMGTAFMQNFQNLIEDTLPFIHDYYHRAMLLKYGIDIGKPHQPLLETPLNWSDEKILDSIRQLEVISEKYKIAEPVNIEN